MINNGIPHNEDKYFQQDLPIEALIYNKRNKNSGKINTFLFKGISERAFSVHSVQNHSSLETIFLLKLKLF